MAASTVQTLLLLSWCGKTKGTWVIASIRKYIRNWWLKVDPVVAEHQVGSKLGANQRVDRSHIREKRGRRVLVQNLEQN